MPLNFVPDSFDAPRSFSGDGYHFEPLGPEHNERDYAAWMGSIDHIKSTPGFADWDWPQPMSLEENLSDLQGHANDFTNRTGFTYSILDGEVVVGCLYIYPAKAAGFDASVRSWVTADRANMDVMIWRDVSDWLASDWPFDTVSYATRA